MRNNILISAEELQERQQQSNLRVLEATFFLPNQGRNAVAEFESGHIAGAQFFDIDAIADIESDLPHMLPTAEQFSEQMQMLGINDDSSVIVYDRSPFLSSARCWWMFRLFGHKSVYVLDGGYNAWKATDGQIETGKSIPSSKGNFTIRRPAGTGHITLDALRDIIANKTGEQILDARPSGRFAGDSAEPRPGLPSGHMPGACNLPIMDILNEAGFLRSDAELKNVFHEAGIDLYQPIITTCGSGVTAAGLTLALATIGIENVRLYDGSWAEWGSQPDAVIEKGHA